MKTFKAIRKPVYIATLVANGKEFLLTSNAVAPFLMKHPEYTDCSYDATFKNGEWFIQFYRECAIDFVE